MQKRDSSKKRLFWEEKHLLRCESSKRSASLLPLVCVYGLFHFEISCKRLDAWCFLLCFLVNFVNKLCCILRECLDFAVRAFTSNYYTCFKHVRHIFMLNKCVFLYLKPFQWMYVKPLSNIYSMSVAVSACASNISSQHQETQIQTSHFS